MYEISISFLWLGIHLEITQMICINIMSPSEAQYHTICDSISSAASTHNNEHTEWHTEATGGQAKPSQHASHEA